MAIDFSGLDDEVFMERWTEAAADLDDAKSTVKAYSEEFSRREATRVAREMMDNMGDDTKAALAQYFVAEGIESQEAVNG